MPDTVSVSPSDRLPWLSDPAPRAPKRTNVDIVAWAGWAVAAVLLIGGGAYWLGMHSARQAQVRHAQVARSAAGPTLTLPEPEAAAQPQVSIPEPPQVRPAPVPVVSVPEPRTERPRRRVRPQLEREEPPRANLEATVEEQAKAQVPVAKAQPAPRRHSPLTLWPSRKVKGAKGRLVQIGAFGSVHQAKLGWREMQQAYPAVGRLPAVVVDARNSKGKKFYRFQIGTTSQAHSEILCQRMEKIHFSCAVLGLPWKAKVER